MRLGASPAAHELPSCHQALCSSIRTEVYKYPLIKDGFLFFLCSARIKPVLPLWAKLLVTSSASWKRICRCNSVKQEALELLHDHVFLIAFHFALQQNCSWTSEVCQMQSFESLLTKYKPHCTHVTMHSHKFGRDCLYVILVYYFLWFLYHSYWILVYKVNLIYAIFFLGGGDFAKNVEPEITKS